MRRAVIECGVFKTSYREDMAIHRTPFAFWRNVAFLGVLLLLPLVASRYQLALGIQIGIFAIGALGLNILTGYTGQISIGAGAFFGVGAYTSAILATRFGLPFWVTLPAAGAVTALVGLVFGSPSLRLKGLYLAIATLAAQIILEWAMNNWSTLTGGSQGISRIPAPALGPLRFDDDRSYYLLTLVIVVAATLFAENLFRTRIGRAFVAVRDRDIAAEVMGINLFQYKLLAFAVSSFYLGVAGSLWAHYLSIITPEHFTIDVSVQYLAMIIIGGMGSIVGSLLGAAFITLLPVVLREGIGALSASLPGINAASLASALREVIFGAIIVGFLLWEPAGLARLWQNVKDYFRLWPFAY